MSENVSTNEGDIKSFIYKDTVADSVDFNDTIINNKLIESGQVYNETIISLEYVRNKWSWITSFAAGDTIYNVEKQGFVVLNDGNINKSTFAFGVKYQAFKPLSLRLDFERHEVESLEYEGTQCFVLACAPAQQTTINTPSETFSYDKIFFGITYSL